MLYRKLGSSDLEVSEIALGSWLTVDVGPRMAEARACTDAALEAGINFFDTANVYGRGAAEAGWGEILARRPRDSFIMATKVHGQMSADPRDRGLSAAQITKQIDASLGRLRMDYVDLYQAHRFDPDVPLEETVDALKQVVSSGKARYLGFSEWTVEQVNAAIEIAGPDLFVASQPQYSMLWQVPELDMFPVCEANAISQIVWSPLAQGLLTGKYRQDQTPPAASRAGQGEMRSLLSPQMSSETLACVAGLRAIAEDIGLSVAQLALAWVLRRREVASAIVGASRPEQVHENARASGFGLSGDVLAAIDDVLGDVPRREPTLARGALPGVRRDQASVSPAGSEHAG